jgi:hypothetical protein
MVNETVHVGTTIERSATDVYEYASRPTNLASWAAGLAHQEVQLIGGEWVVDSPLGTVVVAFVPTNPYGVLDHDVTLPTGETVTNPMRVMPNGDGCDVVFTVRRRPEMTDADFAGDVAAVTADLATLRDLLQSPT